MTIGGRLPAVAALTAVGGRLPAVPAVGVTFFGRSITVGRVGR